MERLPGIRMSKALHSKSEITKNKQTDQISDEEEEEEGMMTQIRPEKILWGHRKETVISM